MTARAPVTAIVLALALAACGGEAAPPVAAPEPADPGAVHVHGLGIDPADGALFVATHTGLFRAAPREPRATRVGEGAQDTMGFTVVGPGRFLGSGHPDAASDLPPFLGLIESRDAGVTWTPVSLLGEADFHVLEAAGRRVYGFGSDFETRAARFLVSGDGGRTWTERAVPEPLVSLALHPEHSDRLLASGQEALHTSSDGGRTWRRRGAAPGLVAWPARGEQVLVDASGAVSVSRDATRWTPVGDLGGAPAALEAERDGLYAARHDGVVLRSVDGGRTWTERARP